MNLLIISTIGIGMFLIPIGVLYLLGFRVSKVSTKVGNWGLNKKLNLAMVSNLVLTFIIYIIFLLCVKEDIINREYVYLFFFALTAYFILSVTISFLLAMNKKSEMDYQQVKIELKTIRKYAEKVESLNDEMRKFRHDYINMLSAMEGYMDNNDMSGLKNFYGKEINPLASKGEQRNLRIGLLGRIKVPELKGILCSKVLMAEELGINLFIDIASTVEEVNMNVIDLCRCIGIIFDNAIEATRKSENPNINIGVIKKRNSVMIIIMNTYAGEQPKLHEIYKMGFSTKGENRGLGLSNLKEIVGMYKNVSLDTMSKEDQFIQNLEISNGGKNA